MCLLSHIQTARNNLRAMVEMPVASKFTPFFLRAIVLKVIEWLDDKLEDYALSSDAEIISLVAALSEKIDNHAATFLEQQ